MVGRFWRPSQAASTRRDEMTFRIPRWAVAGLDGDREDLHWAVLQPMWHELQTPYEPDPRLHQATPGQRALYALYWLESETSNGGPAPVLLEPHRHAGRRGRA